MHHTRKTHPNHKETQQRLRKLVSKKSQCSGKQPPHYEYYSSQKGRVVPEWHLGSSGVPLKMHGDKAKWDCFQSQDSFDKNKTRRFYVKKSKSDWGHFYSFDKKRLHRKWRRTPLDEPSYSHKQASFISKDEIW